MEVMQSRLARASEFVERLSQLDADYRAGRITIHVPPALRNYQRPLESAIEALLPGSHAALQAAARSLFSSLPLAFDPAESIGPYLAVIDRDEAGRPYRFLDMGSLIATHAFGENDPTVVHGILDALPFVVER